MDLTGKDQAYLEQKLIECDQLKKALCESYQEAYQEAVEGGSEEAIDDWRKGWLKRSDAFDFFIDEFLFNKDPDVRICYALLGSKYAGHLLHDKDPDVRKAARMMHKS